MKQQINEADRRGAYPACSTSRTDRMPAVGRRDCGDHTALADKLTEPARVRALNREMRRQWRRDHPLCMGDRLLLIASAASCIVLLLIAAGALC